MCDFADPTDRMRFRLIDIGKQIDENNFLVRMSHPERHTNVTNRAGIGST
jgi:hypothetical protein